MILQAIENLLTKCRSRHFKSLRVTDTPAVVTATTASLEAIAGGGGDEFGLGGGGGGGATTADIQADYSEMLEHIQVDIWHLIIQSVKFYLKNVTNCHHGR